MPQKIGVLPLARPTFDVAYAEEKFLAMLDILKATDNELVGSFELLMDEDKARASLDALKDQSIDQSKSPQNDQEGFRFNSATEKEELI